MNPAQPTASPLIRHSVTAVAGSVGMVNVSSIPPIVSAGALSIDAITLDDQMPGASVVKLNYTFSYSKKLAAGDVITLQIPYWNNTNLTVDGENCPGNAAWEVTSYDLGLVSYRLAMTVSSGSVQQNVQCTLLVNNLTNLPVTERDIARRSVTASAGSLRLGTTASSDAVAAMRRLSIEDTAGNDVGFAFIRGKLVQNLTVPSTFTSLNFTADFLDGTTKAEIGADSKNIVNSSVNLTLDSGLNPITIQVTGGNGIVETYTIGVMRSLIENIEFTDGDFTFVSGQLTGQSVLVANHVDNVTLTVTTLTTSNDNYFLNNTLETEPSDVSLAIGPNVLNIESGDTTNEGIYEITIIRAAVSHVNFMDQRNNTLASTFVSGTLDGAIMDVPYYVESIQVNATFSLGSVEAKLDGRNAVSLVSNVFAQNTSLFALDGSSSTLNIISSIDGTYNHTIRRGHIESAQVKYGSYQQVNNVTVTFTTFNAFPSGSKIILGFPSTFNLTASTPSVFNAGYDLSIDEFNVTLVRTGDEVPVGTVSLTILNVTSKAEDSTFTIRTVTADDLVIHPTVTVEYIDTQQQTTATTTAAATTATTSTTTTAPTEASTTTTTTAATPAPSPSSRI